MSSSPRLHLVAPQAAPRHILACLEAACAAGDVASLVAPAEILAAITVPAQRLGVAVIAVDDANAAAAAGADGVETTDLAAYESARRILGPDRIVGALCGASRHRAMESAEAGVDYVAFAQAGREELISWWSEIFEIPCIAHDPVEPEALDILLPHRPDFIRPGDDMWTSPQSARDVVTRMNSRLAR